MGVAVMWITGWVFEYWDMANSYRPVDR
ncbi:hypothetical protein EV643_1121, partial [Kribbella sp. VKM Ac-2527]